MYNKDGNNKMKKEEFKAIRKELNLTQKGLARKLGRKERMIRNYEAGSHEIPEIVEKLIYLIRRN